MDSSTMKKGRRRRTSNRLGMMLLKPEHMITGRRSLRHSHAIPLSKDGGAIGGKAASLPWGMGRVDWLENPTHSRNTHRVQTNILTYGKK